MEVTPRLESIGLTKNEIKIYLALLNLGLSASGPIIRKTGIHTSKVYDSLNRLIEKGLISYSLESNAKHFRAVSPDRLIDFLDEKKKSFATQEAEIREIIPQLKSFMNADKDDASAEVFRGWRGMETVYRIMRESLQKGDMNYVFGASKGEDPEKVELFFTRHLKSLVDKGIKQRIIYNEDARGHIKENLKHKRLFEVRHLASTTPAEINIWRESVMVVLLTKQPIVILIQNKKVAESFKQYFEFMWALAKN